MTIAKRPSHGARDGLNKKVICLRGEQEYFCKWGWTHTPKNTELICPSCQCVAITVVDLEGKSPAYLLPSPARKRGVSRSSRTLGRGCDGRLGVRRVFSPDETPGRTAKSCGPDAAMLALSSWEANAFWERRWQESSAHRGEHDISRNTIAQGRPDALR